MNRHILVIDDEDGIRELIQISLEVVAGWDVSLAESGKQGISLAASLQPDAILLDVMMPDMDGFLTLQQLHQNPNTTHIPTILLTAKAQLDSKSNLPGLKIWGIIPKPFDTATLAEDIENLLGWK